MTESLPAQANLRQLQVRAKELARELKAGSADALARFSKAIGTPLSGAAQLSHAQWTIAREYGFKSWADLKKEILERETRSLDKALKQLHESVLSGDVDGLRRLLTSTPQLRAKLNGPLFEFGKPAIMKAVQGKDLAMIDALIEAGADINQRSHWEPGGFGVLDGTEAALAAQLIARGAIVDVHAAAGLGNIDRLKSLLEADPALVNARGGDGGSPLHFARNLEVVELLLARGADVRMRDIDHGSTAAMWQVQKRDILYRLIEAGSPIDVFMACVHGDRLLADRALHQEPGCLSAYVSHEAGDGPFAPDTGGNYYNWVIGHAARPIPVAAKFGHSELARYLLGHATPADRIVGLCFMGEAGEAQRVVEAHPDALQRASNGIARALPDAVHFGDGPTAKRMLAVGFPVTGHGLSGGTALHIASWFGNADLVKLLIEKGSALEDRRNRWEGTPLQWACHGSLHCQPGKDADYGAVLRALVEAGAELGHVAAEIRMNSENWAAPEAMRYLKERLAIAPGRSQSEAK
jgi:ankyrin repeat protein